MHCGSVPRRSRNSRRLFYVNRFLARGRHDMKRHFLRLGSRYCVLRQDTRRTRRRREMEAFRFRASTRARIRPPSTGLRHTRRRMPGGPPMMFAVQEPKKSRRKRPPGYGFHLPSFIGVPTDLRPDGVYVLFLCCGVLTAKPGRPATARPASRKRIPPCCRGMRPQR